MVEFSLCRARRLGIEQSRVVIVGSGCTIEHVQCSVRMLDFRDSVSVRHWGLGGCTCSKTEKTDRERWTERNTIFNTLAGLVRRADTWKTVHRTILNEDSERS
jgi:hypothetical protein